VETKSKSVLPSDTIEKICAWIRNNTTEEIQQSRSTKNEYISSEVRRAVKFPLERIKGKRREDKIGMGRVQWKGRRGRVRGHYPS